MSLLTETIQPLPQDPMTLTVVEPSGDEVGRPDASGGSADDNPFGDSMFDTMDTEGPTAQQDFGENFLLGEDTAIEPEPPKDGDDPFGANLFDTFTAPAEEETAVQNTAESSQHSPLEEFSRRLSEPPNFLPDTQAPVAFPDYDSLFSSNAATSSHSTAPTSSSISARNFDGELVSFRKRTKVGDASSSKAKSDFSKLLAVPLHRMLDNLSVTTARSMVSSSSHSISVAADPAKPAPPTPAEMWVDKYRPKRFTDLVGDESVHRATLAWLKEWDQCVFKNRPGAASRKRKREAAQEASGEGARPPDEWGRPHEKILLLSGPPGLGKTTLAHVVASQAGYNVLEINASDARTGNIIDERIKPALETGQGLGRNKPVLVVVDEVDGATGENSSSFVSKLVQLTIDGKRKRPKPGQKRDPKDKQPLLRPIICICNDLWASSITKLRSIARIVKFQPTAPSQLVKRLREICEIEGLPADTRALSLLVAVSKGDFRGCLNTLQMVHLRKQELTEAVVRAATVGMKEGETSNQAVWNDIFLPLSKKRIKDLGLSDEERQKYVGRLARLVESSGALDKIMTGCFAHYATLHHQDPSWTRYLKGNSWFSAFDIFSSAMRTEQEYAVLGYLPYMVAPLHPIFADSGNGKVGNSRADWEWHVKTKASEEIYKSLQASVLADHGRHSASFRHLLNKDVVVAEFAPILNRIISPPLRPVNSQVIRPEERATLKKLVNVMVSLELRFVQEKGEDGQMMYRLDPPIDMFVTYEGKRAADIAPSRYAVRHMIAAEIEAEYTARQTEAVEKNAGQKKSSFFGLKKARKIPTEEDGEDAPPPVDEDGDEGQFVSRDNAEGPSVVASAEKKGAVFVEKEPVDFFGRPITKKEPEVQQTPGEAVPVPQQPKKFKVAYRFNEGASAAVRKPVKMHSLL